MKLTAVPGGGRFAKVVTVDSSDLVSIRRNRGAKQPASFNDPVAEPVIMAAFSRGTTSAGQDAPDAAPKVQVGMLPKQKGQFVAATG